MLQWWDVRIEPEGSSLRRAVVTTSTATEACVIDVVSNRSPVEGKDGKPYRQQAAFIVCLLEDF